MQMCIEILSNWQNFNTHLHYFKGLNPVRKYAGMHWNFVKLTKIQYTPAYFEGVNATMQIYRCVMKLVKLTKFQHTLVYVMIIKFLLIGQDLIVTQTRCNYMKNLWG